MKTRKDIADLMERMFLEIGYNYARELVSKDCQLLREAGQKEYAHSEGNAFSNFERTAEDLENISREQVLWIFVKKHLDGIKAYINGHTSQREPIQGRINDAVVYLILLRGMVDDNETTSSTVQQINDRMEEGKSHLLG
jgi:hypothetical protein